LEKIVFNPIGYVRTVAVSGEVKDNAGVSEIVLGPNLVKALEGVEGFSHLFVLFYLNQTPTDKRQSLKIHPKGRDDLPLIGIFGTRTMFRPNPIGLTLVELLKIDGNVLTVRGLDAFDGTPVLDIKPYVPLGIPENARIPGWWQKLYEET
jgi:tRNA-Thr(GGU) m(6)t(6)A37 methyltransferase TsaA